VHLTHEPRQQPAQRRAVINVVNRDRDLLIELIVGQTACPIEHLSDEPDVVLNHSNDEVH
jgi:hypothetical protein